MAVGLTILTQLSGIEMIPYCTPTSLTDNGFSDSTALRVSVALGVTYLIGQPIGLAIIDRVGRRCLCRGAVGVALGYQMC